MLAVGLGLQLGPKCAGGVLMAKSNKVACYFGGLVTGLVTLAKCLFCMGFWQLGNKVTSKTIIYIYIYVYVHVCIWGLLKCLLPCYLVTCPFWRCPPRHQSRPHAPPSPPKKQGFGGSSDSRASDAKCRCFGAVHPMPSADAQAPCLATSNRVLRCLAFDPELDAPTPTLRSLSPRCRRSDLSMSTLRSRMRLRRDSTPTRRV